MKRINYYDGKRYVEVEVTHEVAEAYAEISQEERREHWRMEKRDLENSIEEMQELGEDVSDDIDIEEGYISQEEKAELNNALSQLPEKQQNLLRKLFYECLTETELAKRESVNQSAIANRKARALANLKKILKKF